MAARRVLRKWRLDAAQRAGLVAIFAVK